MHAQRPRPVQLVGELVDADDANIVVRQRGEHRGHAHPAEADDDDRLARLRFADIQHGATSGEHRAAQQ